MRNYKIVYMKCISDHEFQCLMADTRRPGFDPFSGYGWRRDDKPNSHWNIYCVSRGHITKMGTVKDIMNIAHTDAEIDRSLLDKTPTASV